MVAVPIVIAVARPFDPVAFDTKTAPDDDIHATSAVTSCVVWSLYVPVATSCAMVPLGRLPDAGVVIAIDVRTAPFTVSVAVAVQRPTTAVMLAMPAEMAVAKPWVPDAFETVATDVVELDHVAVSVRSCVALSVNVPVAMNGVVDPGVVLTAAGAIASDRREAGPTVRIACAVWPVAVSVATMAAIPAAIPLARPAESTVATAVSLDVHVTAARSGKVVPSLNVPVAAKSACVAT